MDTATTTAALVAAGAVATGGAAASSMSVTSMSPSSAPSGVPQPGTGNNDVNIIFVVNTLHILKLSRQVGV